MTKNRKIESSLCSAMGESVVDGADGDASSTLDATQIADAAIDDIQFEQGDKGPDGMPTVMIDWSERRRKL